MYYCASKTFFKESYFVVYMAYTYTITNIISEYSMQWDIKMIT